jgi:trans-aconitate methyltransferase
VTDAAPGTPRTVFDAAYYRRFYRERPVHDRRRVGRLAEGVTGLMGWWGLPVRSVLDVGAGTGLWRTWFRDHRPGVRYRSIDVSEYACRRYHHEQRDIASWRPERRSDLVVCHGVLQYLDDASCDAAIANLAAATRAVLFLEVPTVTDRDEVIDPTYTDLEIHWRSGAWYRARLRPHFLTLGCGIFVARSEESRFYELELGPR